MTSPKHPAILTFPALADEISVLMRRDKEFAGICRDYAQIVADIAAKEHTPDHTSALLFDLLRLRSDLERDIVDKLSEDVNHD